MAADVKSAKFHAKRSVFTHFKLPLGMRSQGGW